MKTRGYLLLGLVILIGALIDRSLLASWIGYEWFSLPILLIVLLSYYQQKYWPIAVSILSGLVYDFYSHYPPLTYFATLVLIALVLMVLVRTIFSHRSFFSLCVLSFFSATLYFLLPLLFQTISGSINHSFIPKITHQGILATLGMVVINICIGALTISFYYRRPNYKLRPYIYS